MFLKNALAYSGTNLISQVLRFIQEFILRKLLLPEVMGIWNFVNVVKGFVSPMNLGCLDSAQRELPILRGADKKDEEIKCRSVTLMYSMAEIFLLSALLVCYILFFNKPSSSFRIFSVLVAALLVITTRLQENYLIFYQGAQLYIPLSKVLFVNNIIYVVALPLGALTGGVYGVLIAALISEATKAFWVILVARKNKIYLVLKWDTGIWKRLISYGAKLRIADYPMSLFMMLDVIWISKFMSVADLAIYSTARSFFLQTSDITTKIGTVFYTRILEKYGHKSDSQELGREMKKFLLLQILVLVPLICWGVDSIMPFLIRNFIPAYKASILCIFVLGFANFFISQNNQLFSIWFMKKKLFLYGLSNIFGLVITSLSICFFWFVLKQRTVNAIALAALSGYFFYFMYTLIFAGKEVWNLTTILKVLSITILGSGWVIFILLVFGQPDISYLNLKDDIIGTIKISTITLSGISPVIIIGLWKSEIARLFLNKLNAKIR